MVPTQANNRLTELLDQVRTEFDGERNKAAEYEQNCKFAWSSQPVCFTLQYALLRVLYFLCHHARSPELHNHLARPTLVAVKFLQALLAKVAMGNEKRNLLISDVHSLVAAQMQEMEMVRQKVYTLEQNQVLMKQRYRIWTGTQTVRKG